jgi:hypothetical protein
VYCREKGLLVDKLLPTYALVCGKGVCPNSCSRSHTFGKVCMKQWGPERDECSWQEASQSILKPHKRSCSLTSSLGVRETRTTFVRQRLFRDVTCMKPFVVNRGNGEHRTEPSLASLFCFKCCLFITSVIRLQHAKQKLRRWRACGWCFRFLVCVFSHNTIGSTISLRFVNGLGAYTETVSRCSPSCSGQIGSRWGLVDQLHHHARLGQHWNLVGRTYHLNNII